MRKPWDFSSRSLRGFYFFFFLFVNQAKRANRGGQIKAGEVIMSLPKSAGIGPDGIGVGWDVGVVNSEAK